MKWMVVSDIHGSALACRRMLECFERENADRLLILGDILYHGPRNDLPAEYDPRKVIAMLNPQKERLVCVRGNCDAEVDQMVLEFPILADYCILPTESGRTIYATHGHRYHTGNPLPMCRGDILLHGHTHVPAWIPFGNENLYCNPGSVSIPKEGSCPGYMTVEGDTLLWKDLDGTVYHKEAIKQK